MNDGVENERESEAAGRAVEGGARRSLQVGFPGVIILSKMGIFIHKLKLSKQYKSLEFFVTPKHLVV